MIFDFQKDKTDYKNWYLQVTMYSIFCSSSFYKFGKNIKKISLKLVESVCKYVGSVLKI